MLEITKTWPEISQSIHLERISSQRIRRYFKQKPASQQWNNTQQVLFSPGTAKNREATSGTSARCNSIEIVTEFERIVASARQVWFQAQKSCGFVDEATRWVQTVHASPVISRENVRHKANKTTDSSAFMIQFPLGLIADISTMHVKARESVSFVHLPGKPFLTDESIHISQPVTRLNIDEGTRGMREFFIGLALQPRRFRLRLSLRRSLQIPLRRTLFCNVGCAKWSPA